MTPRALIAAIVGDGGAAYTAGQPSTGSLVAAVAAAQRSFVLGARVVDLVRRQVSHADVVTRLTKTEVRLLELLATRSPQVVSREVLLTEVWGYSPEVQTRAVHHAVTRLRKKIEDDPRDAQYLVAVYGQGYRLDGVDAQQLFDDAPTAPPAAGPPGLPGVAGDFVGREDLLERVRSYLGAGAFLVLLTGPSGMGKSRLAHQVAATTLDDGGWTRVEWIKPAGPGEVGCPPASADTLVVFDGVDDSHAPALSRWRQASPQARAILTARVGGALGALPGVVPVEVPPLSPEAARALISDRARRVRWGFAPSEAERDALGRIVDRLGRAPLSIELAATWLGTLEIAALEARLGPAGDDAAVLGLAPSLRVGNIEPPAVTVHGRAEAVAALERAFAVADGLVTLTGPAGVGKSLVADAFAVDQRQRYPGGLWRVDLSGCGDLEGIVAEVAGALGIDAGGETPVERVGHTLRGLGRALLVLHRFEHLIDHAGETVARWREDAPGLHILVTSRQPLPIRGVSRVPLANLPIPGPGTPVHRSPAVALLLDRVRVSQPQFAVSPEDEPALREIVATLDGNPLALCLAAPRVRLMGLRGVAEALEGRFALLRRRGGEGERQHETLHGALDWSWQLLDPDQQAVLCQCATFVGTFSWRSAQAVVAGGPGVAGPAVVDLLGDLVDHGLVQLDGATAGRFRLSNSVRAFGLGRLAERSDGAAAMARHGALVAGIGRASLEDQWRGGDAAMARLPRWGGELRAALERALARGDRDVALGAGLGLMVAATWHGPVAEGLSVLDALGAVSPDSADGRGILLCAGWLHHLAGRTGLGLTRLRGLVADGEDDDLALATRIHLARLEAATDQPAEGERLLEGAAAVCRARGLAGLEILAHMHQGVVAKALGDLSDARHHLERAALALDRTDVLRWRAEVLGVLASIQVEQGDAAAEETYVAALAACRRSGARVREGLTLCSQGVHLLRSGDHERARPALEAAADIARTIGHERVLTLALANLGSLAHEAGRRAEARVRFEEARRLQRLSGNVRGAVRTTTFLGMVAAEEDEAEAARGHFDDALRLAESIDDVLGQVHIGQVWGLLELEAGEVEAAIARLTRSVGLGRDAELTSFFAPSLSMLAVANARRGRVALALEQSAEALTLLRALEQPVALALSLVRAAEIARIAGAPSAAEHLAEAQRIADALGVKPDSTLGRALARG